MFSDYLDRIANVQQQKALALPDNTVVELPAIRQLTMEIEPITLGLIDSYELRKCGLFNAIAEKNSVLGKVQDQFRDFEFQLTLLHGLQNCLNAPEISEELKQTLDGIYHQKITQLPAYSANLIFTSQAMRKQLGANQWVSPRLVTLDSEIIHAYQHLQSAVNQHSGENQAVPIHKYQEILEKNNTVGRLWYSFVNASQKLNTINQQLALYNETIVCQPGRDSTKFKYLHNVFNHSFVGNIQAYLARLDAHYFALLPYLSMLENVHPNYQYPIVSAHKEFRQATLRHVDYWQQLFKRCGVTFSR